MNSLGTQAFPEYMCKVEQEIIVGGGQTLLSSWKAWLKYHVRVDVGYMYMDCGERLQHAFSESITWQYACPSYSVRGSSNLTGAVR